MSGDDVAIGKYMQKSVKKSTDFGTVLVSFFAVSRSRKFLNLLSADDLSTLEAALDPEAMFSEIAEGNKIVQRLVEQGSPYLDFLPKKPGPKRANTTNKVDEEIVRLIKNVRAFMGLPGSTPRYKTLHWLARVIDVARELCRESVFFTDSEILRLGSHFRKLAEGCRPEDVALSHALRPVLSEAAVPDGVPTLKALVLHTVMHESSDLKRTTDHQAGELEIFTQLAAALNMVCLGVAPRASYKDWGVTREEILKTALARLSHLKALFHGTDVLLDGAQILKLRHELNLRRGLVGVSNVHQVALESIIHAAFRRQGIHPQRLLELEALDFTYRAMEEGAQYPGKEGAFLFDEHKLERRMLGTNGGRNISSGHARIRKRAPRSRSMQR